MAKEKFNVGNLLPQKPVVLKTQEADLAAAGASAVLEKAVSVIHRSTAPEPPAEEEKPAAASPGGLSGTKKISFDLPAEYYRFIKVHCLDRDISMREYLLELIATDYTRRQAQA